MKPLHLFVLLIFCTTLHAQTQLSLKPGELHKLDDPATRRGLTSLTIDGSYGGVLTALPSSMIYLDSLHTFIIKEVKGMNWPQCYATLAALPRLRTVVIDGGYGCGDLIIPGIMALQQITSLNISGNFSELPIDPVFGLTNLEALSLGACGIDTVSVRIADLKKLRALDLRFNFIERLPPEIGQLTDLRMLDLTGNKLREFPAFIPQLIHLEELELNHNRIGKIPNEFVQLTKLRRVELAWNGIEKLPPGMEALDSLEYLDVSLNRIKKLPAGLAGCDRLEELYCWSQHFNEKDPVLEVLTLTVHFAQEWLNDTVKNYYSKQIPDWDKTFPDGGRVRVRKKFKQDVVLKRRYSPTPELTNDVSTFRRSTYIFELNRWRERKNPAFDYVERLDLWYEYPVLPLGYRRYSAVQEVSIERDVLWMSSERLLRPLKDNPVHSLEINDGFMRKLPRCIRHMKEMQTLWLNCPQLKELPVWLAELPNLRYIRIHRDTVVPEELKQRSWIEISWF